jgi:site-specific DNA-cytosine methylase
MKTEYTVLHLCGGIGGGTLGFNGARGEFMGKVGRFRTLASIDVDPQVCENYEIITGSKAVQMDLFSRQQYIDFHGNNPADDWEEISPVDILDACGGEYPDVVFTSPPCKGYSGLLPEKSAESKKYQALNLLTIRSIKLCLDAFEDDLPSLFLLENVPRITTRGKKILDEIKRLLVSKGYAVSDESHDCGEIGGLGQKRKRYLLIARNEKKMPAFVYKPEIKPLKTIGDVIGPLPMPGDLLAAGPMHKLPNLEWKTWVRLALIRPGGDWRDLNDIDYEKYRIVHEPRAGAWAVEDWDDTSRTVTGGQGVGRSNGVSAINDPRTGFKPGTHQAIYRVSKFEEVGPTITGAHRPNNGAVSICDPRLKQRDGRHPGVYRIVKDDEPAPCVTGTRFGSGAIAIADSKLNSRKQRYPGTYRVEDYNKPSNTVLGQTDIQCGALSVADARLGCSPRSGSYGVQEWDEPAKTVTASGDIHSGCTALADPRIPDDRDRGVYVIIAEDGSRHRPLTTFELAMLQGFPTHLPDGRPFQLTGNNDAKWREWIGNAVPPDAAAGMAIVMLIALMASSIGLWTMGFTEIWVRPELEDEQLPIRH